MKKEIIKNLLLAWRDRSVPAAEVLLEQLFESADQVLLEYADKAENNAMQAKFFEGQRELWLKRKQLETLFHDNLLREVFQFMRPRPTRCRARRRGLEPCEQGQLRTQPGAGNHL